MGMPDDAWCDPFGAPEFYCNDMKLEEVAPGMVRVRMLCREAHETILRCTLIMPSHVVPANVQRTTAFLDRKKAVVPH